MQTESKAHISRRQACDSSVVTTAFVMPKKKKKRIQQKKTLLREAVASAVRHFDKK